MKEMFLVVEPFFVQSKVSVVLGIKLSYGKRNNFFYQQQLFLSNAQENTLRDDRNIIYFNT